MMTNNSSNSSEKFCCDICDYYSSKQSQYIRHLLTRKHKMMTNDDKEFVKPKSIFKCGCGKEYNHRQGLSVHKKKCNMSSNSNTDNLITYLIKENSEFKQMMIEQQNVMIEQQNVMIEQQNVMMEFVKNGTHNTTHTNSHNKTFNLQVFLNETCKDAMNMSDFLNQLQLTTKDLELTGQDGFAVGIGHSFVQGIKALEAHKRPLHCSDLKRETFYIKEDNVWEKEDETRCKLTKAIQKIAHKNILNIPVWKAEHPYCRDQHHKDNDKFLQIMIESMTGKDDPNIMQEYDKIIRNVAKEVFIDNKKLCNIAISICTINL